MSRDVVGELRAKMERADLAIINNDHTCEIEQGHIYVKRGENECCVALPQCQEWALYIGALIRHGPAMLAIAEKAQAVVDRWDTPLWKDVPATAVYIGELRQALSALTTDEGGMP